MDVNFNPNNMPLSMRNSVKKPVGNVGDTPSGVTNRTPIDAKQIYAEATDAIGTNENNPGDIMRGHYVIFGPNHEIISEGSTDVEGSVYDVNIVVFQDENGNVKERFIWWTNTETGEKGSSHDTY